MVKGYYSLIQYCPDLSRLETVNIGVLLFCPATGFLQTRTDPDATRVLKFFGLSRQERARIDALRQAIEERLQHERQHWRAPEDLTRFVDTRANAIQLTAPRFVKVSEPEQELADLYAQLVAAPPAAKATARSVPLGQHLERAFARPEVQSRLRRDITLEVPALRRQLTVPYGYFNGHFNLIQPVSFEAKKAETVINQACPYAIEGHSLATHPPPALGETRLVVVGQFAHPNPQVESDVRALLEQYQVRFFNQGQARELAAEIAATGQLIAA